MINLTSHLGSIPVAVNADRVTYVKAAPNNQGCIVYFDATSIHVSNNFTEVVSLIGSRKTP